MNLLSLLLGAMTSQSSLGSISDKTGLTDKQIRQLIMIAIPLLIRYMTSNASSGNGAQSLLGALSQHTNKKEMDVQLLEADEEDGGRIIGHILGSNKDQVTQDLASQTGIGANQVSQVLAILAPALLCGVSEAASDASVSQENTAPVITPSAGSGIFGALMGLAAGGAKDEAAQAQTQNSSTNGMALLQALLVARK